jgi:hypothetical protein
VAIVHDVVKESGWVLPRPSAVFHVYASVDTPSVNIHTFACFLLITEKRLNIVASSLMCNITSLLWPMTLIERYNGYMHHLFR